MRLGELLLVFRVGLFTVGAILSYSEFILNLSHPGT